MSAILRMVDVRKSYGNATALGGVNLEVSAGEIHAIIGLNGAGKTTLMRAVLGMLRIDSGEVQLFGVAPCAAREAIWACVGHMIEASAQYGELTVVENITVWARLHGLRAPAAAGAAEDWIARLSLSPWRHHKARTLSLGNRQRMAVACALVHEPLFVVLDEPTNGLDPSGVVLVRNALRELAFRGVGVLVSSHHLDEIARIADRISVVHAGVVVGALEPGASNLERRFFDLVYAFDARRAQQP